MKREKMEYTVEGDVSMKDKLRKMMRKFWKENWDIIIFAIIIFSVFNTVLTLTIIPTGSMSPTIKPYDICISSFIPYYKNNPQRGDIVIFKRDNVNYCKRIIGLPNEELSLKKARVFINGEKLEEEYLELKGTFSFGRDVFQIPEGHYFMMGDCRQFSADSRYWDEPYIAKERIMTKVLVIIPTHHVYDVIKKVFYKEELG